ncbi:putative Altered inheritance of mitochondria protein 9, mitochondrial [Glarea lozoyensis 74030]|uniref:Putative Altered inheritance of mitochondria protein 9, mitochondrial n=1 Tax=Glarea lozoyensis (strain ATCC 74030 / MF5533) TaxID=1104152 RepID=H0EP71_GLAL7|nr:putative Altered inheritance of mitochondria protein 9, mitochondrial [Glarea lozoyensis 74030]
MLWAHFGYQFCLYFHIIEFDCGKKSIVRVPAHGWGNKFDQRHKDSLRSQVFTLQLIRSKTSIPVPEILDFSTESSNIIGAPYMVMSFLPGQSLGHMWTDASGPTYLETRRLRSLDTVAEAMSQLASLKFDKIGILLPKHVHDPESFEIGPCGFFEASDESSQPNSSPQRRETGPFKSSRDYMWASYGASETDFMSGSFNYEKTLKQLISYLPQDTLDETFVLTHPCLDLENILVDEEGNLTGMIDWDNVHTVPEFLGYARLPSWIWRDWDPLMYGVEEAGPLDIPKEGSPEQLAQYRNHYSDKLRDLLKGDHCLEYLLRSHIFTSIASAVGGDISRFLILSKVITEALGDDMPEDMNAWDILFSIEKDELDGKIEDLLNEKLKALLGWQDDDYRVDLEILFASA